MENSPERKGKILTVQEMSDYLRVHPSTIYRMLKRNQLPGFRVGTDWRFNLETISEWIESMESAKSLNKPRRRPR